MPKKLLIITLAVTALVLSACGGGEPVDEPPTVAPAAESPTEAPLQPTYTPLATYTPQPTYTPLPTYTPAPTDTPRPADTPEPEPTATRPPPTATRVPPTATMIPPTATEVVRVATIALPTATVPPPPPPTAAPTTPPQPTSPPAPAGGVLRIVGVNKQAEYVDIRNDGGAEVNLAGWTLRSEKGSQDCALGGVIGPGQTLRIWAMASDAGQGGYNCGFGSNIWNNSDPDPAVLIDPSGQEVSRW